jgi:Glucanosyltransferase
VDLPQAEPSITSKDALPATRNEDSMSRSIKPATEPVTIVGTKFFRSNSSPDEEEEFVIRGIDYYPRPNHGDKLNHNSLDLFTDEYLHIWERDIPFLRELGVNAIRLYAVNGTASHENFMYVYENSVR